MTPRRWATTACDLIFTCCHPALAPAARIALTLRLLGGLQTTEIAGAFLAGEAIIRRLLARNQAGPFQIQAAINAVHSDAATAALTDWGQISRFMTSCSCSRPTPVVALNRAVAAAEVHGAQAGLDGIEELDLGGYPGAAIPRRPPRSGQRGRP